MRFYANSARRIIWMTNGSKYDEYWRQKEEDEIMHYRETKDNLMRIIVAVAFLIAVFVSQLKQK